jgi:hypothetical protein
MDLKLNQVDIAIVYPTGYVEKIAPIAGIITGLNSIKLNGNLDATEFTPDLKHLRFTGQLLSTTVNSSNSTLLTALGSNLKFIDVSKINLNDVKLRSPSRMESVKPFDIKYKEAATIGTHGFDQA